MKQEKPAAEELRDFAKRTSRSFNYNEYPLKIGPLINVTYYHRYLYIPNNKSETSFYVSQSNPNIVGHYGNFSGVFIPVDIPTAVECSIRKKDILDKLNPFTKQPIKTGIKYFDSRTIIDGKGSIEIKKFFKGNKIQECILKAFELKESLKILVNQLNVDYVSELKGTSHLGIVQPREWIMDSDTIEKMFTLAEEIKKQTNSF